MAGLLMLVLRGVDAFLFLFSVLVFIDALCASTTIQRLVHLIIRNTVVLSDRQECDVPSGEGRSFRRW